MSDANPSPGTTPVSYAGPKATAAVATARSLDQQFRLAFVLTVGICFVFWLGHYFEREILNRHPGEIRFIREATEAAMRYITIPHIIIAFLFMVSAAKNRTRTKRIWTAGLLLLGAGLCAAYHVGGAKANVVLMVSVYLYFLVHELRDEVMFYHVLGDAPPVSDRRVFRNMVRAWIGVLVFFSAAFVWFGVPLGLVSKYSGLNFSAWPMAARGAAAAGPFLLGLVAVWIILQRYARLLGYKDADELLRTHAPMFRVSLGVLGVLGLSLLVTERAYSLILFHVAGWYVFAGYQLRRYPPKTPPQGLWPWMRTTFQGFRVLHVGMAVVLMAIGLVWTLGLDQTPYLAWLLAPESFLYWTIMHITISFVPR